MRRKQKILLVFYTILFLFLQYNIYAYSTDYYSIDIPTSYTKVSENSFTDKNGYNINIQIVPFNDSVDQSSYTEERLNSLVNGLKNEIDNYREEFKLALQEKNQQYNSGLTETQINEYAKSVKVNFIDKKEIINFTKNNYKCFHIIANYSISDYNYYVEQYTLFSGNNVFTLSISSEDLDYFNRQDIKNIVNSFTIKNFKDSSTVSPGLLSKIISSIILCCISALIVKIKNTSSRKNKEEQENNESIHKTEEKEKNTVSQEKFCTNCGIKIEKSWIYCNNCGYKLK